MLFTINNQKTKKLPTTTLVKQGWQGYLISPGDMYTDPVSGEPQFSCFQMVYCTGTSWWFPTISDVYQVWSLVQQKLSILPLEKFHFEIVLNGLTKLLNFTTVSRKFQTVLTIFWIFRRNLFQHSWERINNDFLLDCSKKILEFAIPSGARNSIFL